MTKSEAQSMYEGEVRTAVGHELSEWYIDLIVDCFDGDATVEECVAIIERENENAYDRAQKRSMNGDNGSTMSEQYAAAHEERRQLRIQP